MCSLTTSFDNITQFRDIVSPRTKRRLISCPNGCNSSFVTYEFVIDAKHFTCTCGKCLIKWHVCLNCPRQFTHYLKFRSLKRHQSSCSSNVVDGNDSVINIPPINDFDRYGFLSYYDFMEYKIFGRKENLDFYFHNQNNQGLSYLVGWSQYHLPNVSSLLRKDEVFAQIRIADLLLGLFPKKVTVFTKLMIFFNNELKTTSYNDKWRCELPTTPNLVRTIYKEGKFAIHNNLPYPTIKSVEGHSYISLNEIIQDALANDNDFEPVYSPPSNKEISRLNESAFCEDLIKKFPPDNDTIDLLLTRWSDNFEPYNVKQNKGNSIWVFLLRYILNMTRSTLAITHTLYPWV